MDYAKLFDKLSNFFLLTGSLTGKLRHFPIFLFSMLTSLASLILLITGYLFWIGSCLLMPDHPRAAGHWYGFAQFKNQNKTAAFLGLFAVISGFSAFFFPPMILLSLWLIVASNVLCCISQYHRLQNPPTDDDTYSAAQQMSCVSYNIAMASLSLLTAFATTLSFVCPLLGAALFGMTAFMGLLVSLVAFNYWLDCNFRTDPEDMFFHSSYQSSMQELQPGISPEPEMVFELQMDSVYNPPLLNQPITADDNDEPQQQSSPGPGRY